MPVTTSYILTRVVHIWTTSTIHLDYLKLGLTGTVRIPTYGFVLHTHTDASLSHLAACLGKGVGAEQGNRRRVGQPKGSGKR